MSSSTLKYLFFACFNCLFEFRYFLVFLCELINDLRIYIDLAFDLVTVVLRASFRLELGFILPRLESKLLLFVLPEQMTQQGLLGLHDDLHYELFSVAELLLVQPIVNARCHLS